MTRRRYIQGLNAEVGEYRKGCIFGTTYDNQDDRMAETNRIFSDRDDLEIWRAGCSDTSTADTEPIKIRRGRFNSVSQVTSPRTTLRWCLVQDDLNDDYILCV